MKKKPVLDQKNLRNVRGLVLARIVFLKKEEDEGGLFLAYPQINTLLDFLLSLMQEFNPRVGFADMVLKNLFKMYSVSLHTGYMFAKFASRPYKEKILARCLQVGSASMVEHLLVLLSRAISEEELDIFFEKNLGNGYDYKNIIALTKKLYPHKVEAFERRKVSYGGENDMGAS